MASASSQNDSRRIRSTTAFVVETLTLLVVLVVSMAVFTQMFSRATASADQSTRICHAVNVAEDAAEEFSADPVAVAAGNKVGSGVAKNGRDGFKVACNVSEDATAAGTLYTAHIKVSDRDGKAYELTTTRYVSGVK